MLNTEVAWARRENPRPLVASDRPRIAGPLQADSESNASLAVAVAAYVLALYWNRRQVVVRTAAHPDRPVTIEFEANVTGQAAADRVAGSISAKAHEVTLAASADSEPRYLYRYRRAGIRDIHELEGPGLTEGRIALHRARATIEHLMVQARREPRRSLDRMNLVDNKLARQLTSAIAGRRLDYRQDRTIAQLIRDQARIRPAYDALIFEDARLSYAEITGLANGLASTLLEAGVRKGEFVPVLMENSLELPVSLLALMSIGAPFVVVDTHWPQARIDRAIARLGARIALRGRGISAPSAPELDCLRVTLDEIAPAESIPDQPQVGVDDVIYGLFTSGSTGEPKCALNLHRGLLNRFQHMSRRFPPAEGRRVLQTSKQVYDGFIWQLFWPLTLGGTAIVPRPVTAPDAHLFVDLIGRHEVTMTDIVPSIFKLLLRVVESRPGEAAKLASLKRILIGGEKVDRGDVVAFRHHCPQVKFTNTYGPTEASIGMIMHELAPEETELAPLGRPIDNAYTVIVGPNGRLLPPGMIGELLIGGDCLGLGYHAEPAATARALTPNPFPTLPGSRLYASGDLGFLLPDRTFQFAGRLDHQVKIGGARIDLLEVEAALAGLPEVRAGCVVATPGRTGNLQLAAYVVPAAEPGTAETRRRIVTALEQTLPHNFIPHRFAFLDRLPLLANGKTDRRALEAMPAEDVAPAAGAETHFIDPTESRLARIWCELLKLDSVGPDTHFFDSGGDSLQALSLILELRHRLGIKVTLEQVYAHPTLRAQARLVRGDARPSISAGERQELEATLRADAALPVPNRIVPPRQAAPPHTVLLTGATGFVGAQLAAALLADPGVRLICPVRASGTYSGVARIVGAMAAQASWRQELIDRIEVVACDLAKPWFGLSQRRFQKLLTRADAAVLNAAKANFLHGYAELKAVNVDSVRDVLVTALTKTGTPVHYISTLSVFADDGSGRPLPEDLFPDAIPQRDGYAQSKWVAERLARAAQTAGGAVSIHRLGEMMAPLATGVANDSALSTRLLAAVLKLGVYPAGDTQLDYSPVDVAAALIARAVRSGIDGKVFHVFNGTPLRFDRLASTLAEAVGRTPPPNEVPEQVFVNRLRTASNERPLDQDLSYVAAVLPETVPEGGLLSGLFSRNVHRWQAHNQRLLSDASDGPWPRIGAESLSTVAHFFARRLDSGQEAERAAGRSGRAS